MNSVCKNRNRVHWTRFVLNSHHTCQPSQLQSGTQSLNHRNTLKKKTKFKLQSLPLTLSLLSHEKSSSLSHSQSLPVAPSLAPSRTAPGAVAASRFRRRRCLSLPSVRLRVAQSFSLSGWQTTSQSKDSLFFLGLLVIRMHCTWCLGVQSFAAISAVRQMIFCSIQVPIVNSPTISSSYHRVHKNIMVKACLINASSIFQSTDYS